MKRILRGLKMTGVAVGAVATAIGIQIGVLELVKWMSAGGHFILFWIFILTLLFVVMYGVGWFLE
jgi:hypothetical protein